MQIKNTIDAELFVDKGNIAFCTFDSEGDVEYKYSVGIYELISQFVSMFQIPGTDKFKLTSADLEEFKELKLELDDSLTLVSAIIEEHE